MIFKNKKYIIVLIIFVLSLLTVYFSALDRENTVAYDNVVGFIVKPVAQLFNFAADSTSDFFSYFRDKRTLINQNYELDNKLLVAEHENSKLKSLEIENERLRGLLGFKEKNTQFELCAATVISKDNSNYYSTFLIDKGADDGIKTNMPVVGARGLIGYVIESAANHSRIQTIIDGGSTVGCVIVRTDEIAVSEGDTLLLNEGLMRMIYIPKERNIVEGDIIETSGLGQIYPKGIAVGRIKEIKTNPITKSTSALILPVEDFSAIREAFVITNFDRIGE